MKDQFIILQKQLANLELAVITLLEQSGHDASVLDEEWVDSADMKKLFHFSDSKLYRLRRDNLITYHKIGNRCYYPKNYIYNSLMKGILKRSE
jgi:hypothetical protein